MTDKEELPPPLSKSVRRPFHLKMADLPHTLNRRERDALIRGPLADLASVMRSGQTLGMPSAPAEVLKRAATVLLEGYTLPARQRETEARLEKARKHREEVSQAQIRFLGRLFAQPSLLRPFYGVGLRVTERGYVYLDLATLRPEGHFDFTRTRFRYASDHRMAFLAAIDDGRIVIQRPFVFELAAEVRSLRALAADALAHGLTQQAYTRASAPVIAEAVFGPHGPTDRATAAQLQDDYARFLSPKRAPVATNVTERDTKRQRRE